VKMHLHTFEMQFEMQVSKHLLSAKCQAQNQLISLSILEKLILGVFILASNLHLHLYPDKEKCTGKIASGSGNDSGTKRRTENKAAINQSRIRSPQLDWYWPDYLVYPGSGLPIHPIAGQVLQCQVRILH